MKKSLLLSTCLFCAATALQAQPGYMPPMGYANAPMPPARMAPPQRPVSEVDEAAQVLKAGLTKLTGFFGQNNRPGPEQIAAFLDKEIAPYFDFTYMAQWAAGSSANRMTDQQKAALETDIKTRFLTTMAQKLTNFNNQTVTYLPPRQIRRDQVELSISIGNRGSYPARLDFRMYKSEQGWKVFDVSANGSSALMYYRQYYRQQMQRPMMQPRYR
jgi:phospholipid transport system substrate-binding protein